MLARIMIAAMLTMAPLTAFAGGTPQDKADCAPDTKKFCRAVNPQDGDMAYLACLQANRAKLNRACQGVLAKYGQ